MHSAKFDKVLGYYRNRFWTKYQVHNAVLKNWITAAEYLKITGEEY